MMNKPFEVAELLFENSQFLDIEEVFELSIEDKRLSQATSDNC